MAGFNLPPGCNDPSDLDYYERINGPWNDDDRNEDQDESCHHGIALRAPCADCEQELDNATEAARQIWRERSQL